MGFHLFCRLETTDHRQGWEGRRTPFGQKAICYLPKHGPSKEKRKAKNPLLWKQIKQDSETWGFRNSHPTSNLG